MARRYSRDNRGRFASGGGGATARGGRLKTAAGNKRKTQTMQSSAAPKSTVVKPKGLKPGSIKAKPASAARRPDMAEVNIKGRFSGQAGKRFDASIDRAVKQAKAAQMAALMKPKAQVRAERAARAEANRAAQAAKPKRTRSVESLRASRAKQIEKRRSITTNPAGERPAAAAKMAANAARTQQRATAFYKAGTKPARAVAKPATKKPLARSGQKLAVQRLQTNAEMGRKGVVSMSARSKSVRSGDVASRRSERLSQIKDRQSGITARRQINRAPTYKPDGSFDQSAANLNQRKLSRSKALQQRLGFAATGASMASAALSQRRGTASRAKPARAAAKPATRRKSVGTISEAKAGRIISRIDANRPGLRRASGSARKTTNAIRTQQRATDFALAASARGRKQGKNLSVNQSLQRAIKNASAKRKR